MSFQTSFLKVLILKNKHSTLYLKTSEQFHTAWFSHYSFQEFELRMNIYTESIVATLERSLQKIFRPFLVLLGEETAYQLFRAYAVNNLSKHFELNTYGKDFGKFIEQTVPWFPDYPYLLDFADFCWYWHQVFLKLKASALLKFKFPVYEIWKRCQPEFKGEFTLDISTQTEFFYGIYQDNEKVWVISMNQSTILH